MYTILRYTILMSMRKTLSRGLCVFVFFIFVQVAVAYGGNSFTRNLKEGDSGEDVYNLQVFLNKNIATKVASSGPGSSGNETTYYGVLTADAVRRYQELYAQEILTPLGLFAGTGFFGQKTREHVNIEKAKIEERERVSSEEDSKREQNLFTEAKEPSEERVQLKGETKEDVGVRDNITATVKTVNKNRVLREKEQQNDDEEIFEETPVSPKTTKGVLRAIQKENQETVEEFIEFLEEGGYLNKLDEKTKSLLKKQIRKDASRDLGDLILESLDRGKVVSWLFPQKPDDPLTTFIGSFARLFQPKEALAAVYPVFGGLIVWRFYCTACQNWAVAIGPPTGGWFGYTYVQKYAYWDFPFTRYAKGWFVPFVQSCWYYVGVTAVPIEVEGVVSAITGTSMP